MATEVVYVTGNTDDTAHEHSVAREITVRECDCGRVWRVVEDPA